MVPLKRKTVSTNGGSCGMKQGRRGKVDITFYNFPSKIDSGETTNWAMRMVCVCESILKTTTTRRHCCWERKFSLELSLEKSSRPKRAKAPTVSGAARPERLGSLSTVEAECQMPTYLSLSLSLPSVLCASFFVESSVLCRSSPSSPFPKRSGVCLYSVSSQQNEVCLSLSGTGAAAGTNRIFTVMRQTD